jgi:hypothetical protein
MRRRAIYLALAAAAFLGDGGARGQPGRPLLRTAAGSPYPAGRQPSAVELCDLNGDARLDVLTANSGDDDVSVLLGDGRGGLRAAPGSPLAAGPKPHLIACGDVDRDGRADLAVTEHDSADVRIFLQDGAGRFAPAPGSPFAAHRGKPHNHGLLLTDLDADGHLDLVTGNQDDSSVSVLLGDGKGSFRAAAGSPFAVGGSPYPPAAGDLDGDRKIDVVTPNVRDGTVSVLLGDGRGAFRPAGPPIRVDTRPYYAAIADLDGDGHADIVTTHDDISRASVLLGDGHGGFRRAATVEVGSRGFRVLLGDLNRDGKPDFLTGTLPDRVVLLLGDGTGRFAAAPGSPYAAGRGPWSLALGDLDGDGKLDVVTANSDDGTVSVLLGE